MKKRTSMMFSRRSIGRLTLGGCLASLSSPGSAALPRRIVAAGGVVTEIVYALGREELLVGVDSTSQFPSRALVEKPNIGYVRALSAEGILSLNPELVLAVESAGPPDALRLVTQAGVRLRQLSDDYSPAGIVERIRAVGEEIGARAEAESLAGRVEQAFLDLSRRRQETTKRQRVLFILSLQNGRVMVGGRGTSAAAMIALAGGVNAADGVEGFKPLSDEGVIAAAPDVILMMARGEHAAKADDVFSLAPFKAIPAATNRAFVQMDALYLLGFGPRTADAARDLMLAIAQAAP